MILYLTSILVRLAKMMKSLEIEIIKWNTSQAASTKWNGASFYWLYFINCVKILSAQIESVYARDKNFELHVTYKVIKFSLLSSPASSPPGWCLSLTWLDVFLLPCWWDVGEYSVMPKNPCLRSWQGCQKQIAKSGVQYTYNHIIKLHVPLPVT